MNDDIVFSLLHTIQWSLSQPIHRDEEASLIWDRFYYEIGISHVMYEISIYIYNAHYKMLCFHPKNLGNDEFFECF